MEKQHFFHLELGEPDFQMTLTDREREYIHQGDNSFSRYSRELTVRSIRALGYTLDELEAMSEQDRNAIRSEATRCWNRQDWTCARHRKPAPVPYVAPRIIISHNAAANIGNQFRV